MENISTNNSRRSFLKITSLTGGGMMIGFSWLANLIPNEALAEITAPKEWVELTGFIKLLPTMI